VCVIRQRRREPFCYLPVSKGIEGEDTVTSAPQLLADECSVHEELLSRHLSRVQRKSYRRGHLKCRR